MAAFLGLDPAGDGFVVTLGVNPAAAAAAAAGFANACCCCLAALAFLLGGAVSYSLFFFLVEFFGDFFHGDLPRPAPRPLPPPRPLPAPALSWTVTLRFGGIAACSRGRYGIVLFVKNWRWNCSTL